MASIFVKTAATAQPVTAQELADHLKLPDEHEETAVLERMIKAVTAQCEKQTSRQFVTATKILTLDAFEDPEYMRERTNWDEIRLPHPPLSAINSVKYKDTAGVQQTLAASKYVVDTRSEPGRIVPAFGEDWPATRAEAKAVEIDFDCGYGAASLVPDEIKQAILMGAAWLYNHREATARDAMEALPNIRWLLDGVDWGAYA